MSEQNTDYKVGKTLAKGGIPITIVIIVKVLVELAKSQGITIDDGTALTIAMSGYGTIIGFMNWLKNRKKK